MIKKFYFRHYSTIYHTVQYIRGTEATGGTAPTDPNSYPTGASVRVLENSGNLVKDANSYFAGWQDVDYPSIVRQEGSRFTITRDTTFQPKFSPGERLYLCYCMDGKDRQILYGLEHIEINHQSNMLQPEAFDQRTYSHDDGGGSVVIDWLPEQVNPGTETTGLYMMQTINTPFPDANGIKHIALPVATSRDYNPDLIDITEIDIPNSVTGLSGFYGYQNIYSITTNGMNDELGNNDLTIEEDSFQSTRINCFAFGDEQAVHINCGNDSTTIPFKGSNMIKYLSAGNITLEAPGAGADTSWFFYDETSLDPLDDLYKKSRFPILLNGKSNVADFISAYNGYNDNLNVKQDPDVGERHYIIHHCADLTHTLVFTIDENLIISDPTAITSVMEAIFPQNGKLTFCHSGGDPINITPYNDYDEYEHSYEEINGYNGDYIIGHYLDSMGVLHYIFAVTFDYTLGDDLAIYGSIGQFEYNGVTYSIRDLYLPTCIIDNMGENDTFGTSSCGYVLSRLDNIQNQFFRDIWKVDFKNLTRIQNAGHGYETFDPGCSMTHVTFPETLQYIYGQIFTANSSMGGGGQYYPYLQHIRFKWENADEHYYEVSPLLNTLNTFVYFPQDNMDRFVGAGWCVDMGAKITWYYIPYH